MLAFRFPAVGLKRLTHCFEREDNHHVPGFHGGDQDREQRITQKILVHPGHLTATSIVLEHALDAANHAVQEDRSVLPYSDNYGCKKIPIGDDLEREQ